MNNLGRRDGADEILSPPPWVFNQRGAQAAAAAKEREFNHCPDGRRCSARIRPLQTAEVGCLLSLVVLDVATSLFGHQSSPGSLRPWCRGHLARRRLAPTEPGQLAARLRCVRPLPRRADRSSCAVDIVASRTS